MSKMEGGLIPLVIPKPTRSVIFFQASAANRCIHLMRHILGYWSPELNLKLPITSGILYGILVLHVSIKKPIKKAYEGSKLNT